MTSRLRLSAHRVAAAVVLTAAASLGVVGLSSPAQAAACTGSSGVTVVVDPHQLGGGIQQGCAAGSGKASTLFSSAGVRLDRAQQDPGFVCRVAGAPADAPCQRATSPYWSLWWNDGSSSSWVYATAGVDGLSVPAGGSVAFSWSEGDRVAPGVDPVARAAAPAPTKSESAAAPTPAAPVAPSSASSKPQQGSSGTKPKPSSKPSVAATTRPAATPSAPLAATAPTAPTSTGSATAAGTASATPAPTPPPTDGPSDTVVPDTGSSTPSPTAPTPTASSAQPTSEAVSADDGGLPSWLAPVLVVLVFGAAGATTIVRRRRA